MHPAVKTTQQNNTSRIEELLEQLVIRTLAAALSHLIDRNDNLRIDLTARICKRPICPYTEDIQF